MRRSCRALQQIWTCRHGGMQSASVACYQWGRAAGTASDQQQERVKGVMAVNLEGKGHNSPVLLGLMDEFEKSGSTGFFQPIAGSPYPHSQTGLPAHVELMKAVHNLPGSPEDMVGVSAEQAIKQLAEGRHDDLLDTIYTRYEAYRSRHDTVLLEGAVANRVGLHNTLEVNARIAATIDTPILMVLEARHSSSVSVLENTAVIAKQSLEADRAEVVGLILNRMSPADAKELLPQLRERLGRRGLPFAGALPFNPALRSVRLDELRSAIGAKLMYGQQYSLDAEVGRIAIGAQSAQELLESLEAGAPTRPLVITSRDRADLILAVLAANASSAGPHVTGLLLTEGEGPGPIVDRILRSIFSTSGREQMRAPGMAVLQLDQPLFDVAQAVGRVEPRLLPSSTWKVQQAKEHFAEHIDMDALAARLVAPPGDRITPKAFQHQMMERCQAEPQHIVLPESHDHRVLRAACEVMRRGLAKVTLLGNPEQVKADAAQLDVDLSGCRVLDHTTAPQVEHYAAELAKARKKKNMTLQQAQEVLEDRNAFGTLMVKCGDADGMVSGATTTTANTIRPALQVLKSKDRPLVSSIFFMLLPDKVLCYADCAVVVEPTAKELAMIAVTSAETAQAFGLQPRIALLSYSTGTSGAGPQVERVNEAVTLAKEMRPDLKLEGPIQYDAAVDPVVAAQKVKGESEVAGKANVLIFLDLNTGNNTYKAVQQATGAIAMGPVLQGLARPINDLSRGCTVADIINTVTCTSVQALGIKAQQQSSAPAA